MQNMCWICQKHQGQKPGKSARGGGVLGPTRGKNPGKVPVVLLVNDADYISRHIYYISRHIYYISRHIYYISRHIYYI
ncbi:MAG: hypothetical protein BWX52_01731 [Bacteroidetes bacterium ADurb.Bin013]|nr:MAG: hypothetical protein BWX52_01731 [Bacteroidetes bacterium ADurb.Bin013]